MSSEITQLRTRRDEIDARLRHLADTGRPDDQPEFDRLVDERAAVNDKIAAHSTLDDAATRGFVLSGDGASANPASPTFLRRSGNPWEHEVRGATATELRDRALFAAERTPELADESTGKLSGVIDAEPDSTVASRWAIAVSRPAYREAFNLYLRQPTDTGLYLSDEQRAAFREVQEVRAAWNEGTGNQGGWAVPIAYDVALMDIVNNGSSNPMRELADVRPTTSNLVYGLTTAGLSAGFITESTEEGDDTPTVAQPSWTVHRASAYIQASFEVLADSSLGSDVPRLFMDARDNLEAEKFVTGTGGGEPYGVVNRVASLGQYVFGSSGSTVESELAISDVFDLVNALPERYQANASLLMHRAIGNSVRALGIGDAGTAAQWVDLGPGNPPTLLGYPVWYSSAMDSVVASGSSDDIMLVGDFKGYRIYDRLGSALVYNPLVVGTNRRPTGEAGFFYWWRTSGDVVDQTSASHFRLLHK